MTQGDVLVVLFYRTCLYTMRSTESAYRLLGECCVPGVMRGEAVQKWKDDGSKRAFFELT
jgi:hypothetical protein